MRILVTGGAGYIGSHALRLFLEHGQEAWAFDNLFFGHRSAVPAEKLIIGDLSETHRLDHVFVEKRIEAVVHFAAFTSVGESVREPGKYYQNNVVNTLNLLESMRRHRIGRLVFSSTAAVYGAATRMPISEDDERRPINPYGQGKLIIEQALGDYARAYGLGYAALRYFNAAGAHPDGTIGEDHSPETHLIPLVIQTAQGQRPHVEIFGVDYPTSDGACIRDYVHVVDLAEAHRLALEKLAPGAELCFNLGTGRGHSVREVIAAVQEVTGKPVATKEGPRRPGDPPELVASPAKIQRELGWRPQFTDLRSIVETAWKWHSARPRGYRDR